MSGIRVVLLSIVAAVPSPSPLEAGWSHLGDIDKVQLNDAENIITLTCGKAKVQITAVQDGVIRIRLAPHGYFGRDFSWSLLDRTITGRFSEGQHLLAPLRTVGDQVQPLSSPMPSEERPLKISPIEVYRYETRELNIKIQCAPCRITIADKNDHVIISQDASKGMAWDGERVAVWHRMPETEQYLGLGEKGGGLNKRNMALTNWTTDAYGYQDYTDPLYHAIPFFIVARDKRYAGIFFDNPHRTFFDFGKTQRDAYHFGAEGGELDYYVIAGPKPKDVLRRYTDLTGRMPMPPKWALGYQQCRYSYFPDSRVLAVARAFRERKIPCDVIYLDIDYMNQYRCFTWHPEYFPDPAALLRKLHDLGFHVVTIVDPGIKKEPGYWVYDEGKGLDAYVKNPDGTDYVGRVWPGPCVFPDFTNLAVRRWWGGLHRVLLSAGVDGIWTDMNEPADFGGPEKTHPLQAISHNEGQPASSLATHNVYGLQMARATYEGLRKLTPHRRPFVITRAAYAGVQRYSSSWTGDNSSTWEHLRLAIAMCQGIGISGVPFVGCDIGGFVGGAYPELYARWIQLGALLPFSRSHTEMGNPDQEPWSFGNEVERIARDSIGLRYRLMPYLYTHFYHASRTGVPVLRPVFFEFPECDSYQLQSYNFMLGEDIYVYPITRTAMPPHRHRLPPGVWFDWHRDQKIGGGEEIVIEPTLEEMPMFIRGGAIIPMQSIIQHTAEKPAEPLILEIYPHGESRRQLYEDAGDGYDYQDGRYLLTTFVCRKIPGRITFEIQSLEGKYQPADPKAMLRFHGLIRPVTEVTLASTAVAQHASLAGLLAAKEGWHYDQNRNLLTMRLKDRTRIAALQIATEQLIPADAQSNEVVFDFGSSATAHAWYGGFSGVQHHNSMTTYRLRGLGSPFIMGQPLWLNGEAVNRLILRISSEDTKRVIFKFGTFDEPRIGEAGQFEIKLTADGQLRDYVVDLVEATSEKWENVVTGFRLDFPEELPIGSKVVIDEIRFAAAQR